MFNVGIDGTAVNAEIASRLTYRIQPFRYNAYAKSI